MGGMVMDVRMFIALAEQQAQAQRKKARVEWRDLHWKRQVKLAQDMGADVKTALEARAWLEENA